MCWQNNTYDLSAYNIINVRYFSNIFFYNCIRLLNEQQEKNSQKSNYTIPFVRYEIPSAKCMWLFFFCIYSRMNITRPHTSRKI